MAKSYNRWDEYKHNAIFLCRPNFISNFFRSQKETHFALFSQYDLELVCVTATGVLVDLRHHAVKK